MSKVILTPPPPDLGTRWQPGITDPIWKLPAPDDVDPKKYADRYAGQLERQRHLHIVTAEAAVSTRRELGELLLALTEFTRKEMHKRPPDRDRRPYDPPVETRRVTITVGFGATLFTTIAGDDRFNLAARRPRSLKIMPQIDGDEGGFHPRDHASDLIILIASDDYYVNEFIFGWMHHGNVHPGLRIRQVERGYARPDSREPSGFEDGISNPRNLSPAMQMNRLVYVTSADNEPGWCVDGTYLAYRKIRRRMASFFEKSLAEQEKVFGVEKSSGLRKLSMPDHAHAQKMNPRRRNHRDLFGKEDEERRFLRRPYFFNDGIGADGMEMRGLHHLSFVRNLGAQYEWPVLMWQTNPDFPFRGAGRDDLYTSGGASNIGGGYYFMPPAPRSSAYLGSQLLA